MKVALYMRVSTDEQTTDNQEIQLIDISKARGYTVVGSYKDIISGKKKSRPELDRMLSDARKGKFDIVLSVKVDRISRSLRDLLHIAGTLGEYNIDLKFTDQDFDISSSQGKLMFQILGAFGEFEREMIVERTKAGLRRAKGKGQKLGRPKINGMIVQKVKNLHAMKRSYREISKQVTYTTKEGKVRHVSVTQVSRILKGVPKTPPSNMEISPSDKGGVPKTSVIGTEEADQ